MTAEEILEEWLSQTDQTNLKEGHYFVIKEVMKEFAELKCKELLEIVAEKAKTEKSGNSGSWYDARVDKDSILNAVDLKEFIK
ncbi:hypothetical protein [Flavobacterium sp.]|jgi:hypothetical protein|uniref:hypothetical protein n=1 Tax=Flavobacterium sp. TaxID=239 RepID=UPI0037C19F73